MNPQWATCPRCQTACYTDAPAEVEWLGCPDCRAAPAWFYARGRSKLGPFDWQEFRRLAAAGVLQPQDMVLRQGSPRWTPAHAVPGLFASGPAPPTPAAPAPPGGTPKVSRQRRRTRRQRER